MRADQVLAKQRLVAERRRERLDVEVPDKAGKAVQDAEQRDKRNDLTQGRRVVQRSEQHALDHHAAKKRQHDRANERDPIGLLPFDELPGDKRREHRHFALGEIQMIDRLVDHHDRQRHRRIDRPSRQPGQDLLEEEFHRRSNGRSFGLRASRPPCQAKEYRQSEMSVHKPPFTGASCRCTLLRIPHIAHDRRSEAPVEQRACLLHRRCYDRAPS